MTITSKAFLMEDEGVGVSNVMVGKDKHHDSTPGQSAVSCTYCCYSFGFKLVMRDPDMDGPQKHLVDRFCCYITDNVFCNSAFACNSSSRCQVAWRAAVGKCCLAFSREQSV